MKRIHIHAYIQTSDNGFAPCYDNHVWTLACCKSDIRYRIGKSFKSHETDTEHFVICYSSKCERIISIARIKNVHTTSEYFSCPDKARADKVYYYHNDIWYTHKDNPHTHSKDKTNSEEWIPLDETHYHDIKYPRARKAHPLNFVLESEYEDFVYYETTSKDDQCKKLLLSFEEELNHAPRNNAHDTFAIEFIEAFEHDKLIHRNEYPKNSAFGGNGCRPCNSKNNTCINTVCT